MKFTEWATNQFDVKIITEGKYKGRICFKTPCFNYTLPRELWEEVKKKINEV